MRRAGGESGIRTHVRVSPKHAFQACAFSHSAISPRSRERRAACLRSARSFQSTTQNTPSRLLQWSIPMSADSELPIPEVRSEVRDTADVRLFEQHGPPPPLGEELRALLGLAIPVVLSELGWMTMTIVDLIMV